MWHFYRIMSFRRASVLKSRKFLWALRRHIVEFDSPNAWWVWDFFGFFPHLFAVWAELYKRSWAPIHSQRRLLARIALEVRKRRHRCSEQALVRSIRLSCCAMFSPIRLRLASMRDWLLERHSFRILFSPYSHFFYVGRSFGAHSYTLASVYRNISAISLAFVSSFSSPFKSVGWTHMSRWLDYLRFFSCFIFFPFLQRTVLER